MRPWHLLAVVLFATFVLASAAHARQQPGAFVLTKQSNPDRVLAYDSRGRRLATFVKGAYTVSHTGPSRKSIDGPTLGDYSGKSILNGAGLYATAFRASRRL
jgi:hypothetical protein